MPSAASINEQCFSSLVPVDNSMCLVMHSCLGREVCYNHNCTLKYILGKAAADFFCLQLHNPVKFRLPPWSPAPPSICQRTGHPQIGQKKVKGRQSTCRDVGMSDPFQKAFKAPTGSHCVLKITSEAKYRCAKYFSQQIILRKILDLQRFINMHQVPKHKVIGNQNTVASF